jgi:hypothetical protein
MVDSSATAHNGNDRLDANNATAILDIPADPSQLIDPPPHLVALTDPP